jgi:SAM-dependent methyltransferase
MNEAHEANRRGWDAAAPQWQSRIDALKDWRKYARDPALAFRPQELEALGDVAGSEACVLGSGDNLAAFALAGLGARVTSVDFSQVQLSIAARRAEELGLKIDFVHADVTDLKALTSSRFDAVYTGGHVAVWVSDLARYYAEAGRILKPGGLLLINEYHPFRRIWAEKRDELEREFRYFDRGPHRYDRSEEVPGAATESLPSCEFHWTVADLVNGLLRAGCRFLLLEEFGEDTEDWEVAPLGGLPAGLVMVGKKE